MTGSLQLTFLSLWNQIPEDVLTLFVQIDVIAVAHNIFASSSVKKLAYPNK